MTPWTAAHQAPPSMGFSRQESWSGLTLPSPGDLPDPGIQPASPALADRFFTAQPPRKPNTEQHEYAIFVTIHNHVDALLSRPLFIQTPFVFISCLFYHYRIPSNTPYYIQPSCLGRWHWSVTLAQRKFGVTLRVLRFWSGIL